MRPESTADNSVVGCVYKRCVEHAGACVCTVVVPPQHGGPAARVPGLCVPAAACEQRLAPGPHTAPSTRADSLASREDAAELESAIEEERELERLELEGTSYTLRARISALHHLARFSQYLARTLPFPTIPRPYHTIPYNTSPVPHCTLQYLACSLPYHYRTRKHAAPRLVVLTCLLVPSCFQERSPGR